MTHNQSKARTATVAGLARLAGLAAMTGAEAITADSVTLCAPPADAVLVGLCADLTEMEQISRSRGGLGGLFAQRQALMTAISKTKAISCNGVKSKARVVRLVLGGRVVSRHMQDALISSLLEDIQGEILR